MTRPNAFRLQRTLLLFWVACLALSPAIAQRRRSPAKATTTTLSEATTTPPSTTTLPPSPGTSMAAPSAAAPPSTVPARLGVPDPSPTVPQGPSWGGMLGAFLFVVCLAALCSIGAAYFMRGKTIPWLNRLQDRGGSSSVRVLESIPLGQRRYLTVIDIGGEKHLLGLTASSIQYLTRIPPAESTGAARGSATGLPVSSAEQASSGLLPPEPAPGRETPPSTVPVGTFEEEYRKLKARLSGK